MRPSGYRYKTPRYPFFLAGILVLFLPATVTPESPELTRAEKEEFLRTAEIVKRWDLSEGITNSQRATLTDGHITHDAHIQTVDIWKPTYTTATGTEINFKDSYKFNIAAYRLDKLLNLNMIPVSVERKVAGDWAAVTWWVDDVLMMEKERYLKDIEPPDLAAWNDQIYQVRVFINLVFNKDPNLGNLLITKDWKIWMVDFTRSFRLYKQLKDKKGLVRIDRRLYEGLKNLTKEKLTKELDPFLTGMEIEGVWARRNLLLEYFDKKIARSSEAAVICDRPGH